MLNHLLLIITFLCFPTAFAQSPALPPQPPTATQSPAQPPQVPATQSPPLSALAPQVPLVQSPPAQLAPGPALPGPPNITAILEKAGHFSIYIRLLKATQIDNQIYKLLNDSSQSLTMFAPSDNAFGNLSTVSNPLSTQAGSTVQYPMNVTTAGNLVNISTGIVNTSDWHSVFQ
ncbi:Fasciclin-like arabinogalactan protein 11 [Camellia lanceoleosa]|uniref:Fasciclin-like arabinogalactan protein 11 n=1 Tax=Camellia lanceoleosa TaxID=1840588 RepID=A0ACC0GA24_9ERIC|nr:Fasciclin-like arabinogalactan protein 11 [Camellia lanceoleosa]